MDSNRLDLQILHKTLHDLMLHVGCGRNSKTKKLKKVWINKAIEYQIYFHQIYHYKN